MQEKSLAYVCAPRDELRRHEGCTVSKGPPLSDHIEGVSKVCIIDYRNTIQDFRSKAGARQSVSALNASTSITYKSRYSTRVLSGMFPSSALLTEAPFEPIGC